MTPDQHERYRELLGAYVLGHLSEEERREADAHLDSCPLCRIEVEELRPVAAMLANADPARIDAPLEAPPTLEGRVFAAVDAARAEDDRQPSNVRRLWPRVLPVLAAAAVVILVLVVVRPDRATGPNGPETVTLAAGPVEGTATLVPKGGTVEIELTVKGLSPSSQYRMALRTADGETVAAEEFTSTRAGSWFGRRQVPLPREESVELALLDPSGDPVATAELPEVQ